MMTDAKAGEERNALGIKATSSSSFTSKRIGSSTSGDAAWLDAHHDPVASLYTFSTCMGKHHGIIVLWLGAILVSDNESISRVA